MNREVRQATTESREVVHSAADMLVNSTRALVDLVLHSGSTAAKAVAPEALTTSVGHLLQSMRKAAEEMPQIGRELDIVMDEIRAKRLTIQAMAAELSVLDAQLEVLERALSPLEAWNAQWERLGTALLHVLEREEE